ncbi:MAG: AAC(3) family N-acetyltransferase [Gammaproteobacteria bacterium]|nr:AAC(3) family N-acetyltransferase [Gammaproteobacteria bacterium]
MPSEAAVVAATPTPITAKQLVDDLRQLGVVPGTIVIVHASLSAIGWVIGGAQTVVEALLTAVGAADAPEARDDRGTLVMPAQSSQLSDPANWSNPPVPEAWYPVIREQMPAYDRALTPIRGLGAIADCLLRHPATLRSPHPLASFSANGAAAKDIVGEHPLVPSLGETSPLGRLYELDAKVLLLGVGHDRNTSLHLAEHRADWPSKRMRTDGAPVRQDGARQWISFEDLDFNDEDFNEIGAAFAATGHETSGRVGRAHCRLMPQRALVDFASAWISANRA